MNIRTYIDSLFEMYEETSALVDFKEELESNLKARICHLEKTGLDEQEAFNKAIDELGNLSTLANELSLQKKQEVISHGFMKNYVTSKRMALYVFFSSIITIELLLMSVTFLDRSIISEPIISLFGECTGPSIFYVTSFVLMEISIPSLVYLGLTQESASFFAMAKSRAFLYAGTCALPPIGLAPLVFRFISTYDHYIDYDSIIFFILFLLPSLSFGIFLVLSEKNRRKPWLNEFHKKMVEREMKRLANPVQQKQAEKFGLLSGALWITAITVFILLSITIGFKFSWIVIVSAIVIELLILAAFTNNNNG